MLNEFFSRSKYKVGFVAKTLTAPFYEREISPSDATTIFGCSFGFGGWHHIVNTLEAFDKDEKIPIEETPLYKFLTRFCPKSVSDFVDNVSGQLPVFEYPWGNFSRIKAARSKDPLFSRFCGPSTTQFVEMELAKILDLKEQIMKNGYNPCQYPNSHISGTWLVGDDNISKFVVMQGNHRLAVLAYLGFDKITVRSSRMCLKEVDLKHVRRWENVKNGLCSEEDARKIFQFFFDKQGFHVKDKIERERLTV